MSTENKSEYLVEVRHLKEYFPVRTGFLKTIPLKAVQGQCLFLINEEQLILHAITVSASSPPV